jgi:hypothetical protein
MEVIAPMIAALGFFTMIGWIVYVVVDGRRRQERLKVFTEFHTRLLDRIGSAREFGEFLQTNGGSRFLDSLSMDKGGGPQTRILRYVHIGTVLLALGLGLAILGRSRLLDFDSTIGFTILGTIALSLAVGFLVSSFVSHRLMKALGLMKEEPPKDRTGVA